MDRNNRLDRKIVALQNAVETLKQNRDQLIKELEMVKSRTEQKQTI